MIFLTNTRSLLASFLQRRGTECLGNRTVSNNAKTLFPTERERERERGGGGGGRRGKRENDAHTNEKGKETAEAIREGDKKKNESLPPFI